MSAPSEQYKMTAVRLDGGLDFVTPPSLVEPGKLVDCMNYEVVDRNGYKRIDGYNRWDGSFTFADDREVQVNCGIGAITVAGGVAGDVGKIVYKLINNVEVPVGVITEVFAPNTISDVEYFTYAPIVTKTYVSGSSIYKWNGLSANVFGQETQATRLMFNAFADGIGAHELCVGNTLFDTPRQYSELATSILGVHYFNDKAYVIKDAYRVSWAANGFTDFYPGDVIHNTTTGVGSFILLNPTVSGGFVTSDVLWVDTIGGVTNLTYPYQRETINIGDQWSLARPGGATGMDQYTPINPLLRVENNYGNSKAILHETIPIDGARPYLPAAIDRTSVTAAGSGYTGAMYAALTGGGGFGAKAVAVRSGDALSRVILTNAGNGYTSNPTVAITGAGGTGATASATARDYRSAGIRPINTGWKVPIVRGSSASGFLTKLNRQKGPTAQTTAYTTANKEGVPFLVDTVPPTETPGSSIVAWSPSSGGVLASHVQTADANGFSLNVRDVYANQGFRSTGIAFGDFADIYNNVPDNSVITGIEILVDWVTDGGFSAASDALRFDAVGELFEDKEGVITKVGGTRTVAITPPTAVASGTVTFGSPTDLWGIDGLTIEDLDQDFRASFQLSMQRASAATYNFNFRIDRVRAKVYYRSASITYYFASSTDATNRNVVSATLVSYNKKKGDLTQNNWQGILQVADLDVVRYCPADSVGWINITNGGSGYTSTPTVTIDPSPGVSPDAVATAVVEDGVVVAILLTNAGAGYAAAPNVTITGGGGSGATATAVLGALPGIMNNYGVFLDASLNVRVGTTSSTMEYNGLDTYTQLEQEKSRYEIVSANFYADEEWEGIYGVSGAGPAFYYDGRYFSRIYAIGLDDEEAARKDKPRHLCNYRYHLALGYKSGSVLFSKIGEPENFDGEEGAVEVGVGDRITGIYPLPGQYLAVFCDSSIWGITGKTASEFSLENIVPSSGAIEYSIVAMGDKPIYCDAQGISTLSQSDLYGNFIGNRMSHKVTPWLLPRLRSITSGTNNAIVAAYPVRKKNQYRVWFQDGLQLVMTLIGQEQEPQFTITKLLWPGTANNTTIPHVNKVVPLALCSCVDSSGEEQILFSVDKFKSGTMADLSRAAPSDCLANYLYKNDYGNSFSVMSNTTGTPATSYSGLNQPFPIPANFTTAFTTVENPFGNKTARKVRLEGTQRGLASLAVYTEKEYLIPDLTADTPSDGSLASYTNNTALRGQNDFYPSSRMANVAETGRVINFRISNHKVGDSDNIVINGETYVVPDSLNDGLLESNPIGFYQDEPSHYVQLLLVQYEEGKNDA